MTLGASRTPPTVPALFHNSIDTVENFGCNILNHLNNFNQLAISFHQENLMSSNYFTNSPY